MTSERWRQVSRIYHDALAQDSRVREVFVREACAGDEAMRHEVESLLAQPSGDDFLAAPAWQAGSTVDESRSPSLISSSLSGRQLGPYRLQELLGAGGMGEVYRAHDSKLGRDVAIKILPREFTAHPERLARFEREARLLAALNHPHIAAIYGFEEDDDIRGLVLELVDGETLAQRIRFARMPVAEVLAVARAIAEALDAAHEKGIVHRDLKPANVKIRSDGTVKVLDFGLAKAMDTVASSPSSTTDVSVDGLILGTPAYMSPEQARGKPVDKRADVWSFGCLVYEMSTGRAPFAGDTVSDTMAAILEREPDFSKLPSSTPLELRRLLERCLVKDPRHRLRDIGDACLELDAAARPHDPAPARPKSGRYSQAAAWVIALAAFGTAGWLLLDRARTASPTGATSAQLERLTFDPGLTMMPALSPPGELLAFASDRAGRGDLDIWVARAGGGAPLRLTDDPADDETPDFSPDGKQIVFRSGRDGGGVYLISSLGGPARLLFRDGKRPRFSPDGSRIAYWTGPARGIVPYLGSAVFVAALDGAAPIRLVPHLAAAQDPVWAPDGRSLLVIGREKDDPSGEAFDWWWVPLDGRPAVKTGLYAATVLGETVAIQSEGSPAWWNATGVLFAALGNLWSIPISTTHGRATGPAVQLTAITGRAINPTSSLDGTIVFSATQTQRAIERARLDEGHLDDLPQRLYQDNRHVDLRSSVSADGGLIAFEQLFDDHRQIWTLDTRTGRQQMILQTERSVLVGATISPDGAHIVYTTARTIAAVPDGFVVDVAGGVPRSLCKGCAPYGFLSDNRRVLAVWNERRTIGTIDIHDGSRTELVRDEDGDIDRPHVSPDDRWLVFRKTRGGTMSFLVRVTPNRPPARSTWQKVDDTTTGRPCGWSPDSRTVYLFRDVDGFRCLWGRRIDQKTGELAGGLFAVRHFHAQATGGPSTSLGNPITADGFLYERTYRTGDLWRLRPATRAVR